MQIRLDKYSNNPTRDHQHALAVSALWHQYRQRYERHSKRGFRDPKLEEFRWQIEELRISLFAQELKTPYPVSVKRLQNYGNKFMSRERIAHTLIYVKHATQY